MKNIKTSIKFNNDRSAYVLRSQRYNNDNGDNIVELSVVLSNNFLNKIKNNNMKWLNKIQNINGGNKHKTITCYKYDQEDLETWLEQNGCVVDDA